MKQFRLLIGAMLAVTAVVVVVIVVVNPIQPTLPPVKAIWVTRFDYSTPEDVRSIINNVAAAGFTDVFFQVRGNGSAFYKSSLEPWAYELSGENVMNLGRDPGWDPLEMAIENARPYNLRVHAYINVLPGWKGNTAPPALARQLWSEHPDWFMVDSLGNKMLPTSGWYSFINPALPEVRQHIKGIVSEICAYDISGVHLDYIRYPHDYHIVAGQHYPDASDEELMRHSDFSYDSFSQTALFEKYGWDVSQEQITEFRCETVTRLVRDISYVMQIEKPHNCLLTASVMGNPIDGKYRAYQDSGRWAREGITDWVVQMNYATKSFTRYLAAMKKATGRKAFQQSVVVGIYCKHDIEILLEQLHSVNTANCRGLAVFSYGLIFDKAHNPNEKGRKLILYLRHDR